MFTIGSLAKKYALSRSTLIYYDHIGLLPPSGRSAANYRLYTQQDIEKLERIMLLRRAGMPLDSIAELIEKAEQNIQSALEKRLLSINQDIQQLRTQQQTIIHIIKNEGLIEHSRIMTKSTWVSLLATAGLDEQGMKQWHEAFEASAPEAHQDFLESIGIEHGEITTIRAWSRKETE